MTKFLKRVIAIVLCTAVLMPNCIISFAEAEKVDGWEIKLMNNCDADVFVDKTVSYSGDASLKIVNRQVDTGNLYVNIVKSLSLTEGRKYLVGAKVKAEKANSLVMRIDWSNMANLVPFGGTYDWTNFEYEYTAKTTKATNFQIISSAPSEAVWIDDIVFIDTVTGENLITNSNFDTNKKDEKPVIIQQAGDGSMEEIYNNICSSEMFYASDMELTRGGFRYMPVYGADGISIDGDFSEWDKYAPLSMPTLSSQYQIYIDDDAPRDMEGSAKFAYDDENFYLYFEVSDDTFYNVEGSGYWKGDSIQCTLSTLDEDYGCEIGFAHNPKTGKGEVYSSALSSDLIELIQLQTKQEGDKTYYEAAIPWTVKTGKKPNGVLFDFIFNDNDGDGRRYCVELAPGIAEGKTNEKFPLLEFMNEETDWYAWVQGTRTGMMGNEYNYEYFLVNESDEDRKYTVTNSLTEKTEEFNVPAGMGVRREFTQKFDNYGEFKLNMDFALNDETITSSMDIKIERPAATKVTATELISQLKEQEEDLKELMDECSERGLSTDYENIAYELIKLWKDYVQEDIDNNSLNRIYYQEETTLKLYEDAKANLEAYIAGDKEPIEVPRYVDSEHKIQGKNVWATNEYKGSLEERPTFFIGYGHTPYWYEPYMEMFNSMGANSIQMENAPKYCMDPNGFGAWETTVYKNANGTMSPSKEAAHSGKQSAKLTFASESVANTYLSMTQDIYNVEPGKTYEFKAYVKANNAAQIQLFCNGWAVNQRIKTEAGTYDWKEYKIDFAVPEGQNSTTIMINIDNKSDAVYIDDVSFTDKETGENLISDGGFEYEIGDESFGFSADIPAIRENIYHLERAKENNLSVDLLFGPHVIDSRIIEKLGIGAKQSGFLQYNIDMPQARKLIEEWLRFACQEFKEYDVIKTICISNEPAYFTHAFGDYYVEEWQEFLKERYNGDIDYLNRAWKTSYNDFSEINFSGIDYTGNEDNPARFSDYRAMNDKVLSRWHKWMVGIIKEYFPNTPVHSKIMSFDSYNSKTSFAKNTWNGTGFVEHSEFLDLNGCDAWDYGYDWGYTLSEELWYDYMMSVKEAPIINSEDHIIPDKYENYDLDIASYMNKIMWQGAIRGRAYSDIWHWKRRYSTTDTAWGSVLFRPDAVYQIEKTRFDVNRLAYEILALQDEEREVGILLSDESMINDVSANHAMYQAYAAATFNGKRVQFILANKAQKIHECKLVIVPNTQYISSNQLNELKKYIQNGGKVLIMGTKSLKMDEKTIEHNKETVDYIYANSEVMEYAGTSGAMLKPAEEDLYEKVRSMLKDVNAYYVEVLDAETNKPVDYVEYNVGVHDGKVLVNLVNYNKEDIKVNIYINSELVTKAKELRSDEEVDVNGITLEKYIPILLSVETENKFFDTYGHWAEEDIVSLVDKEIINGVTESRYQPDRQITRAEFLSLLVRNLKGSEMKYTANISDVKEEDWFSSAVMKGVSAGIVSNGEQFRPNDCITREEMCGMLVKAYEYENGEIKSNEELTFSDADRIEDKDTVAKAVELGFMLGRDNNCFEPKANSTRAEAAAVISRYIG